MFLSTQANNWYTFVEKLNTWTFQLLTDTPWNSYKITQRQLHHKSGVLAFFVKCNLMHRKMYLCQYSPWTCFVQNLIQFPINRVALHMFRGLGQKEVFLPINKCNETGACFILENEVYIFLFVHFTILLYTAMILVWYSF